MTTLKQGGTALSNRQVLAVIGGLGFMVSLGYILFRVVYHPLPETDFRFFWVAGKAWAQGIDPYNPAFAQFATRYFPDGNVISYWFYPPQWWITCRLLATMPLDGALEAWRITSALLINAAAALVVSALVRGDALRRWSYIGISCAFATLIEPTANLLSYGQSTAPIQLAAALVVAGVILDRGWAVTCGLLLATLKPQLGILLFLAILIVPRWRLSVAVSLVGAVILGLPQFLAHGPLTTLHEFLSNMSQWNSLPSNTALTSSGPLHLLARLVQFDANPIFNLLIAMLFAILSGWLLRRRQASPLGPLFLLTSSIAALVPLHPYDMGLLVVPVLLAIAIAGKITLPVAACIILMIRPSRLEAVFGLPIYGGGVSAGLVSLTIAALVLLALAVRYTYRRGSIDSSPEYDAIPIRSRTT